MAQLLVGHNFKTAHKNPTKLHTTIFQHVFNHFVKFQSKWTINVEMTVALELGVQKINIVDTSNIGCVWHVLCRNKEVPGLSMGSNCHHYHLTYNLKQGIAQLSRCSDSYVQQTWLAQKDSPVVVFITMALIATQDLHRVSSKRIGEIVNSCIDDLEIKAHTLKGDTFMHLRKDSVFEACL